MTLADEVLQLGVCIIIVLFFYAIVTNFFDKNNTGLQELCKNQTPSGYVMINANTEVDGHAWDCYYESEKDKPYSKCMIVFKESKLHGSVIDSNSCEVD
jgi:hypothetical protein